MGSFLDKLLLGVKQVWRNGTPMPQRPVLNLIGFQSVLDNPTLGTTDVYSSTGGSGGGSALIIENNGTPMPFEPALNIIGGVLTDNPGNASTDVIVGAAQPVPGATINSTATLTSTNTLKIFAAGSYTITQAHAVAGVLYRLLHDAVAPLETANVFLSAGSASYVIEDPITRVTSTSVQLATSKACYEYMLDGTNNILRCVRPVR